MSSLSTLPKGDSAWLLRKSIQRIMQQVSVLETNIGSSTTGNSANTQVIFNDNGTLRGDTGLTFNKTTDTLGTGRLTTSGDAIVCSSTGDFYVGTTLSPQFKVERATGAATITGDLTVDTNTLKVDSAGNRVIIGATTVPDTFLKTYTTDGTVGIGVGFSASAGYQGTWTNHPYVLAANGAEQLRIAPLGVFTFADGLGGTRMTLNSTGLGVGVSPDFKFAVNGTQAVPDTTGSSTTNGSLRIGAPGTGLVIDTGVTAAAAVYGWIQARARTDYSSNFNLVLQPNGGNVGIGVTPAGTGGCLQLKSGITFPATQVASSDANTLDDYEEGTWTPTISAGSGTPTTVTVNLAKYTKVGRLVSLEIDISIVDIGTASGLFLISIPFTSGSDLNVGALRDVGATAYMGQLFAASSSQISASFYNNATVWVNGYRIRGTYTYTV